MINDNWAALIRREFDLPSYLEIQYETHYRRFLMPTIRGLEKGARSAMRGWFGKASEGVNSWYSRGSSRCAPTGPCWPSSSRPASMSWCSR